MNNLRKLEHSKDYMSIKKVIANCTPEDLQKFHGLPKIPQITHLQLIYSVAKEWSPFYGEAKHNFKLLGLR